MFEINLNILEGTLPDILYYIPAETETLILSQAVTDERSTLMSSTVSNRSTILFSDITSESMDESNQSMTPLSKLLDEASTEPIVTDTNSTHVSLNVTLEQAIATEQYSIRIYSIMIFVSSALAMAKTYALFSYTRRASINVHKAMVQNSINAVMSFYDTHFIGNVLNRFSQDLNNIDEVVPFVITDMFRVSWFNIVDDFNKQ